MAKKQKLNQEQVQRITASEGFTTAKLKSALKEINASGLLSSKIKVVGKNEDLLIAFFDALENQIPEDKEKELPVDAVAFYNECVDVLEGGGQEAPEPKAKAKKEKAPKAKKEKEPKPPSVTRVGVVGEILKKYQGGKTISRDKLLKEVDEKCVKEGKGSNEKETRTAINKCLNFAEGFGLVQMAGEEITVQ